MATIRESFHSLGNIHNMVTVKAGLIKELIKTCLERKDLSRDLRSQLEEIERGVDKLVKHTQDADKKTREIHDRVYKLINPDTEEAK